MTAYQITSMMEGVVQRGTGTYAQRLNRPVAGKTGTTSDSRDVWFIGFTPELVAGVYLGYDKPKSLGDEATGGALAVPVFTEFMQNALKGKPPTPFNMPAGMTQVWIDPATGVKANAGDTAIAEAFKPGHRAEPRDLGDRGRTRRRSTISRTAAMVPTISARHRSSRGRRTGERKRHRRRSRTMAAVAASSARTGCSSG